LFNPCIKVVMAGLVPAIPTLGAQHCHLNRDARDKRGHDVDSQCKKFDCPGARRLFQPQQ
jgi:hypothetical protein